MYFRARVLRLSVFFWCRERPQVGLSTGMGRAVGEVEMACNWLAEASSPSLYNSAKRFAETVCKFSPCFSSVYFKARNTQH